MTGNVTLHKELARSDQLSMIAIAIAVLPFFQNALGLKWPAIGLLLQFYRYGIIILLSLCFIGLLLKKKMISDVSFIYQAVFFLILFCSNLYNGISPLNVIQLALYGLMPFLLLYICCSFEITIKTIIGGIALATELTVLINLVLMILFPAGIYRSFSSNTVSIYYLFGAKNQMVAPVITCMVFSISNSYVRRNALTIRALIICAACIIELAIGGSGTGLVISIIFCLMVPFIRSRKAPRPVFGMALVLLVFFLFVVLRVQYLFEFLIVDLLHKTLTLSDRTYIWDAAFTTLKGHLVLGTGVGSQLTANVHLVLDYVEKDTFAHDAYLDILLMGGLSALLAFAALIHRAWHSFASKTNKEVYLSFIWWGLVLYLLASVFDIYVTNYCLYLLLIILIFPNSDVSISDRAESLETINE